MQAAAANARSSYASQAEKWKRSNGGESAWKQSAPASSSVSELVLISELCSAVGQSSFPPRDVLNKLLRHVHTVDHRYICELLDAKLEDTLWQVVARALAVLDALCGTDVAANYLDYFYRKRMLFQYLLQHPKQTVKSRAEKILALLETFEVDQDDDDQDPPLVYEAPSLAPSHSHGQQPQQFYQPQGYGASSLDVTTRGRNHSVSSNRSTANVDLLSYATSPPSRTTPAFAGEDMLLGSPYQPPSAPSSVYASPSRSVASSSRQSTSQFGESPRRSAPLFQHQPPPQAQAYGFGFMRDDDPPLQGTAFSFVGRPPPPASPSGSSSTAFSYQNEEPSPVPSSVVSAFSFVQSGPQTSAPAPVASSGFAFLDSTPPAPTHHYSFHQQPPQADPFATQSLGVSFLTATKASPKATTDRITDAFADLSVDGDDNDDDDDLVARDFASSVSENETAINDMASELSEDHPLASHAPSARDEFETLKKAGMAREVILEVELPAGPMGIVLDRTIHDSAVLAKYAPLPSGEKGLIELHPAITPGCLLVAINGQSIEHLALPELGPVLASASAFSRVLTFKKFMVGSRVMHPVKLRTAYAPPRPESVPSPQQPPAARASAPPQPAPTSLFGGMTISGPTAFAPTPSTVAPQATGFGFLQSNQAPVLSPRRMTGHEQHSTGFGFMQSTSSVPVRASPQSPKLHAHHPAPPGGGFDFMRSTGVSPRHTTPQRPHPSPAAFDFMHPSSPANHRQPQEERLGGFDFMQGPPPKSPKRSSMQTPHQTSSPTGFGFLNPVSASPRTSQYTTQPAPASSTAFNFMTGSPPSPKRHLAQSHAHQQPTSPRGFGFMGQASMAPGPQYPPVATSFDFMHAPPAPKSPLRVLSHPPTATTAFNFMQGGLPSSPAQRGPQDTSKSAFSFM
ncbi:Aste57867_18011 [Aphanomyces stellatus]|uniref:Aste57867_18011 protein n=1 Tax=Aphanomyces stellatus TaxID=120398 RepID=A0A485LAL1_9STRA|nr:hypothetical protein As57867_017949 [Aphanomyces stellatus]VFT94750.1 Aste57867_18011 [Aphanomyces stellatus]